jgi:hypothetical protein
MGRLRDLFTGTPKDLHREEPEPLEGTRMDLFNSILPSFYYEQGLFDYSTAGGMGTPQLVERTWVSNRCIQLNAQQVASMPLRFESNAPGGGREPAWVSSPDPTLFPNGIGDALHAIVSQLYGWGFSCQYVTDFYDDLYPRRWTVLPSEILNVRFGENGRREYRFSGSDTPLDARRIIQIDRNPTTAAHGTSALKAFAQNAYGLLAAGNQSQQVSTGGIPQAVLKSQRKLTAEQAEALQAQWVARLSSRTGPPILPPELDFQTISFNPSDLALLDTQEFNAKILAAAFGVPAVLLNMSVEGSHVYQSPQALGEMWWRFELRTVATRIANAFTAQALPAGNWVAFDAADTFLPLDIMSEEDDPQLSQVAKASPAQQPVSLQAIGGGA